MNIHLFDWPSRHNVHLALPLMIIVSLGLHVAGMVVFQIAPSNARPVTRKSAEVYFLSPGSPAALRLAPVLAGSDPALYSPGRLYGRETWRLPETTYLPSFDASGLLLEPPPTAPELPLLPPVSSTGPVAAAFPVTPRPAALQPGPSTTARPGGALAERPLTPPPDFRFPDLPRGLAPATFLVAAAPDGRLLHLFPQDSSGNETFDRATLRYLAGSRFAPADGDLPVWGTVTFHWGVPAPEKP